MVGPVVDPDRMTVNHSLDVTTTSCVQSCDSRSVVCYFVFLVMCLSDK